MQCMPEDVLHNRMQYLNALELAEIKLYAQVFFFDYTATRSIPSILKSNLGYDTDSGVYKCYKHDHIAYRFELLGKLGHGSFGDVLHAYDHKTERDVAIKIVINSKKSHVLHNTAREIKILEHLHRTSSLDAVHALNVVAMHEHFMFRNHLCIVFEKLDHGDLFSVIERHGAAGARLDQVRQLTTSMLHCVHEIHTKGVIHCDIKPENFLLTTADATAVKIIDFGLSCLDTDLIHSHSFGSLFYSAPEVQLDAGYGTPIDMWSVGCIVAELCTGKPLFGGKSSEQQLALQTAMLGMPPAELLDLGHRSELYFERTSSGWLPLNAAQGEPGSRPMSVVMRGKADADVLDFVTKCVQWEPAKRMTAAQALQHPFILGMLCSVRAWSRSNLRRITTSSTAFGDGEYNKVAAIKAVPVASSSSTVSSSSIMSVSTKKASVQKTDSSSSYPRIIMAGIEISKRRLHPQQQQQQGALPTQVRETSV